MKSLFIIMFLFSISLSAQGNKKPGYLPKNNPKIQQRDSIQTDTSQIHIFRDNMPKIIPEQKDSMPKYQPSDSIDYKMKYYRVAPDSDSVSKPRRKGK